MALTESNDMALGSIAPYFTLPDVVTGKFVFLGELRSQTATVVMFICNHCPYVVHIDQAIVKMAKEYQAKGVTFVAISSNDARTYPQDAPDKMKERAEALGFPFPYLYDETQETAQLYNAACTPEFFVFDDEMRLAYHGQFDDARPKNDLPITGKDLRAALDSMIAGEAVSSLQKPSMGCNIKWKNA